LAKVSVIIPLFNRGHLVSRALNSLCAQDFDDWEAIVVDDGSTDDGPELVKKYARKDERIRLVNRTREPKGPSCCRNIGAEKSTAKYLVFLDSDDELAKHCLGTRCQYMESRPDLDFAVFPLESFSESPGDKGEIFNTYCEDQADYLHLFLQDEAPWQTTCPIWKKDFYLKIGGFNEAFLVKTDPELHSRALLLHNPRFEVVEATPDCYYRIDHHDVVKQSYFSEASINCRILFIKESNNWISSLQGSKIEGYQADLAIAFKKLFLHYLISNASTYYTIYKEMLKWGLKNHILSIWNYQLLVIIGRLKVSTNPMIKKMRLIGLFYRMIS